MVASGQLYTKVKAQRLSFPLLSPDFLQGVWGGTPQPAASGTLPITISSHPALACVNNPFIESPWNDANLCAPSVSRWDSDRSLSVNNDFNNSLNSISALLLKCDWGPAAHRHPRAEKKCRLSGPASDLLSGISTWARCRWCCPCTLTSSSTASEHPAFTEALLGTKPQGLTWTG